MTFQFVADFEGAYLHKSSHPITQYKNVQFGAFDPEKSEWYCALARKAK